MTPAADPAKAPLFPRLRWVALAFLVVWAISYASVWGWRNFLHLCDVTVFLTVVALFFSPAGASALLLSSQVVVSLVVNLLWVLDVIARLALGRHIIGGTEYMFDPQYPLFVRLLSLFHLGLPALHLWALHRTGYDRRGLALGTALVAVLFVASWLVSGPVDNLNFTYRDPLWNRTFGPPLVHVAFSWLAFAVVVFVPTHLLLARLYPVPRPAPAR